MAVAPATTIRLRRTKKLPGHAAWFVALLALPPVVWIAYQAERHIVTQIGATNAGDPIIYPFGMYIDTADDFQGTIRHEEISSVWSDQESLPEFRRFKKKPD